MEIGSVFEIGIWDVLLFVFVIYIIYSLFFKQNRQEIGVENSDANDESKNELPEMKKRNFSVIDLLPYDGVKEPRILMAVCGKVFDVTSGAAFYGSNGPYSKLAGHDATRALSTMNPDDVMDEYDDLSGVSEIDLSNAKEWAQSFMYKYPVVGRLLKDGEKSSDGDGVHSSVAGEEQKTAIL